MENNNAAYWKERYEAQEQLMINAMTDLENYRSLVHRLKNENHTLKCEREWAQKDASKNFEQLRDFLIEQIQYGYRYTYQN